MTETISPERIAELFDIPVELVMAGHETGPELRIVAVGRFGFADYRLAKVIEEGTLYTQEHEMQNLLEGGEQVLVLGVRLETDDEIVETYMHRATVIAAGDKLVYRFSPGPDGELLGPAGEYEVREPRRWDWR